MSTRNVLVTAAGVALTATVAGTVGVAVYSHELYSDLDHGTPPTIDRPVELVHEAGVEVEPVESAVLASKLDKLATDPALGTFHGRVTDTTTGDVVWEKQPGDELTPASATKILTASAALLSVPLDHTLMTEVVRGTDPDTVVIKAGGDVWMTPEDLDSLAEQIERSGVQPHTVVIDTDIWTGPDYLKSWDPANVDAGYVAPMQPAMIHGARIGESEGDVPRSHTPAYDVAAGLAHRLGARTVAVGPAPLGGHRIAAVDSPPLSERVDLMMSNSDNAMAEAIAREIAVATGHEPSFDGATTAIMETIAQAGYDTSGVAIHDGSGLSDRNRITPALLSDLLNGAVTDTRLRPLLMSLPVANATGTLAERYDGLAGSGWVRAKTGTLTGVNALAGTVTADSGHIYTFALLSNDAEILSGRRALDTFASAIRED